MRAHSCRSYSKSQGLIAGDPVPIHTGPKDPFSPLVPTASRLPGRALLGVRTPIHGDVRGWRTPSRRAWTAQGCGDRPAHRSPLQELPLVPTARLLLVHLCPPFPSRPPGVYFSWVLAWTVTVMKVLDLPVSGVAGRCWLPQPTRGGASLPCDLPQGAHPFQVLVFLTVEGTVTVRTTEAAQGGLCVRCCCTSSHL